MHHLVLLVLVGCSGSNGCTVSVAGAQINGTVMQVGGTGGGGGGGGGMCSTNVGD